MENQNQQIQTSQVPNQTPSIDNNSSKSKFIPIVLGVAAAIVIAIGALILGTKQNKTPYNTNSQAIDTPTPAQQLESEIPKEVKSNEDKILYEDNGFSLYYPRSLEIYQTYVGDALQWKPKSTDRIGGKDSLDALTLHESTNPVTTITKNGKFTIWNKGYFDARSDVTVNSIKEDIVPLGQNKTTLFTLDCGNNCRYAIGRFNSNKKYYELIYNLNLGNIDKFKQLLADISFFDPNSKQLRTYTSKEGHYLIQYPSNSNFLEKVSWSVDGVRGYSGNIITIFPQKFGISFEKIGDTTLDEYLKKNECATIDQKKRFTLSGEQAEYQSTSCGIEGSSDVFVKHKDMIYVISYTTPDDPILTTFKFTP